MKYCAELALSRGSRTLLRTAPMLVVAAALVVAFASAGCKQATPVTPVAPVADTAPAFADTSGVADQVYAVGEAIGALTLGEASGGNGPLTYSLEPTVPGLAFDANTRMLSGTPTTAGSYEMTYQVHDGDANTAAGDADSQTFTITVREADVAPSFATGVADQIYVEGDGVALVLPEAGAGNGPLTYSLQPEVPGLEFDAATRTLSGTPTVADAYPMTYLAVDADANTADSDAATLTFMITVVPDTAPGFSETVADRTYPAGDDVALVLPEAGGGNGPLTYSLRPEVPGLEFDAATRTLSGTPAAVDTYAMTYSVVDGDANDADSDAAFLRFTITIEAPDGIFQVYGGGNQVFSLNPNGEPLDQTPYTLLLGEASAEVYVIATNTTRSDANPRIEVLETNDAADGLQRRRLEAGRMSPRRVLNRRVADRPWVSEFNHDPPLARANVSRSPRERRRSVATGASHTFLDVDQAGEVIEIPATARGVVTDGTTTLVVWVADSEWGDCGHCVRQAMVDALSERFLIPGGNNDIYDWMVDIFGAPWGPHDYRNLIPANAAEQIHILLFDIAGDGVPESGEARTVGFFFAKDNLRRDRYSPNADRASNERLMFYLDSVLLAHSGERPTWDITARWPSTVMGTLAHEFQHMIRFYQRRIRRDIQDEAWLNEMSSEVAVDLVADKIMIPGPRGVAYDDPTGGAPENYGGRLPDYNVYNHIQVTSWDRYDALKHYAVTYALGAYLARTYGGAGLFRAIIRNNREGIEAIEAGLRAQGHTVSFEEVLADWAVATLLSDHPGAPHPYRYNPGTWSISQVAGEAFRLGSINLYHYRNYYGEGPDDYWDGPLVYTVPAFNSLLGPQPPHSNRYAGLGYGTAAVRLRITADAGSYVTVVVKE